MWYPRFPNWEPESLRKKASQGSDFYFNMEEGPSVWLVDESTSIFLFSGHRMKIRKHLCRSFLADTSVCVCVWTCRDLRLVLGFFFYTFHLWRGSMTFYWIWISPYQLGFLDREALKSAYLCLLISPGPGLHMHNVFHGLLGLNKSVRNLNLYPHACSVNISCTELSPSSSASAILKHMFLRIHLRNIHMMPNYKVVLFLSLAIK